MKVEVLFLVRNKSLQKTKKNGKIQKGRKEGIQLPQQNNCQMFLLFLVFKLYDNGMISEIYRCTESDVFH